MHGVLVVDKPAGITSHDVVDLARAELGLRRVGHTGTLDPFATGVLPLCVGRATRLARFLAAGEKVYEAALRLGFATSTDDLTGEPLGPPRPVEADEAAVREACAALTGAIRQVPPSYSAKRRDGQRLHRLARRGIEVTVEAVPVTVHALEVTGVRGDQVDLLVRCSPGTYVRALARDLGRALGVGGHLAALRRVRSGGFGLEAAVPLRDLAARARTALVPLRELLPDWPAVRVGEAGREAFRHGRDLTRALVVEGFPEKAVPLVRVLDAGDLLGVAELRGFDLALPGVRVEPVLHPTVVLAD